MLLPQFELPAEVGRFGAILVSDPAIICEPLGTQLDRTFAFRQRSERGMELSQPCPPPRLHYLSACLLMRNLGTQHGQFTLRQNFGDELDVCRACDRAKGVQFHQPLDLIPQERARGRATTIGQAQLFDDTGTDRTPAFAPEIGKGPIHLSAGLLKLLLPFARRLERGAGASVFRFGLLNGDRVHHVEGAASGEYGLCFGGPTSKLPSVVSGVCPPFTRAIASPNWLSSATVRFSGAVCISVLRSVAVRCGARSVVTVLPPETEAMRVLSTRPAGRAFGL